MTDMMITQNVPAINVQPARRWRLRTSATVLSAAVVLATMFGPAPLALARLGAGETVAAATVSAADIITSSRVLAEVPGAIRTRVSKIV